MRTLLRKLVHERVVTTAVITYAVVVFLHAFQEFPSTIRTSLYWIDYGCGIYFVVEMAAKVSLLGWSRFWADGWNRFDFVVVALSLPFLLAPVPFLHFDGFGAILLLRLGRLLRLLRLFHFIPNRAEIQQGIVRALRASVGVFLAIFLYTLVLTLISHSFFQAHAPKYFGDPLLSLYSMFQIFTVEGWYEIPNQIAQEAGWPVGALARLYFAFAVLTGGIIGLSLANAVFVDEMVIDNTRPLEEDVASLREQLQSNTDEARAQRAELREMIEDLHERLDDRRASDS